MNSTSEFPLKCSCGRTISVPSRQAGEIIQCECGASLEVPTLRELQEGSPRARRVEVSESPKLPSFLKAREPERKRHSELVLSDLMEILVTGQSLADQQRNAARLLKHSGRHGPYPLRAKCHHCGSEGFVREYLPFPANLEAGDRRQNETDLVGGVSEGGASPGEYTTFWKSPQGFNRAMGPHGGGSVC